MCLIVLPSGYYVFVHDYIAFHTDRHSSVSRTCLHTSNRVKEINTDGNETAG